MAIWGRRALGGLVDVVAVRVVSSGVGDTIVGFIVLFHSGAIAWILVAESEFPLGFLSLAELRMQIAQ